MKTFLLTIWFSIMTNAASPENNLDYTCRVKDRTSQNSKTTDFQLPFNSLQNIELNDLQHRLTINFYGDLLETMIEQKETQKIIYRSINKGAHFSADLSVPKLSVKCTLNQLNS